MTRTKSGSRRHATLTNIVFSYGTVIATLAQALLLVPLYLAYIDRNIYSSWLVSGSILNYLSMLDVGLADVARQRIAKAFGAGDMPLVSDLFGATLAGLCIASALVIIGSVLLAKFSSQFLNGSILLQSELRLAILIAGTALAITFLTYAMNALVYATQDTFALNVIWLVGHVLPLVLTPLMLWNNVGIKAISISLLTSRIFILFCMSILAYRVWATRIRRPLRLHRISLVEMLGASLAVVFSRLASTIASQSDAIFTNSFLGPSETLTYNITTRPKESCLPLTDRLTGLALPSLAHLSGEQNSTKTLEIGSRLILISAYLSLALTCLLLVLNASFTTLWVGKSFFGGAALNALIALTLVLHGVRTACQNVLGSVGEFKVGALASWLEAIVKVVLAPLLLTYFGIIGMALATLASALVASSVLIHSVTTRLRGYPVLGDTEKMRWIALSPLILWFAYFVGSSLNLTTWGQFALAAPITVAGIAIAILGGFPEARKLCYLVSGALRR